MAVESAPAGIPVVPAAEIEGELIEGGTDAEVEVRFGGGAVRIVDAFDRDSGIKLQGRLNIIAEFGVGRARGPIRGLADAAEHVVGRKAAAEGDIPIGRSAAATGLSFRLGIPSAIAEAELAMSRAMAVIVVSLRMSISQVGVAGSATPWQQLHAIAAPISKRAPQMISKVPHGPVVVRRLTSTHLGELSPAKSLIRNADTNLLTWSPTIVANLQRSPKYTLILPNNLAVLGGLLGKNPCLSTAKGENHSPPRWRLCAGAHCKSLVPEG